MIPNIFPKFVRMLQSMTDVMDTIVCAICDVVLLGCLPDLGIIHKVARILLPLGHVLHYIYILE